MDLTRRSPYSIKSVAHRSIFPRLCPRANNVQAKAIQVLRYRVWNVQLKSGILRRLIVIDMKKVLISGL